MIHQRRPGGRKTKASKMEVIGLVEKGARRRGHLNHLQASTQYGKCFVIGQGTCFQDLPPGSVCQRLSDCLCRLCLLLAEEEGPNRFVCTFLVRRQGHF